MRTPFDAKKVSIENSTSPNIYYEGLGKIAMWWYDTQSLHLDYTFKLFGTAKETVIPCAKSDIITVLEKLAIQD